jgi:hypothetical protein
MVGGWIGVLLLFAHQGRFDAPTPVSRLDLLHSLFAEGTFSIDTLHSNTPDKAIFEGHYYSDKAPGTAAVAFPAFAAAAAVGQAAGVELASMSGWLLTSWVACAWSQAVPAAIGAGLLFAWLAAWAGRRTALLTVLALFIGAAPLPYATMLFSHKLVVGLLCTALWAIQRRVEPSARMSSDPARPGGPSASDRPAAPSPTDLAPSALVPGVTRNWLEVLTGFCVGLAVASEFTAGMVAVALTAWLAMSDWRRLIPVAIGAIPPLLLIPAYSYACFGNPFILPYSLQASFPAMREGLYAIQWPDAQTAFNLLFSPTRGLFFWSPFLVMAGFGYSELFRRSPRLFWLTCAVPVVQIVVISGRVWDWQAGPTLGPRYLAPILPLLALPCALGVRRWPRLGAAMAIYSVAITTLATLTDACPMGNIYNPLTELHIPLLLKGEFPPNLGRLLGLPPYASVALFYAILVGGLWWPWHRLPDHQPDPADGRKAS